MPDIASDKVTAVTYPPQSLYEDWQDHADELDMSTSRFLLRMTEAGRNHVDLEDIAQRSIQELHEQNTDLQRELERQRARNDELERKLRTTVHGEIIQFVEQQPGATMPEIIQHVADTVPGRVAGHLDLLEEDALEVRGGDQYYPTDTESAANESSEGS